MSSRTALAPRRRPPVGSRAHLASPSPSPAPSINQRNVSIASGTSVETTSTTSSSESSSSSTTVNTDGLARSQLHAKVTDHALYPYLLRLAILTYRNQPRFRNDSSLSAPTPHHHMSLSPQASRSHSRNNSFDVSALTTSSPVGFGGTTPSFGNSKLPKDALKLLQVKFKDMALKPNVADDGEQQKLLRRSYLAFYAVLLSPETIRQFKESRRAEELVMRFVSCAAKELNKAGVGPAQLKTLVDSQCASFVRLLISTIVESGSLHSQHALIKQLESYEASLLSSTEALKPGITSSASSSSLHTETPATAAPTFNISDMNLAQDISALLLMANSEMQRDITDNKSEATEALALTELQYLERELRHFDRHLFYRQEDFRNETDYLAWKESELQAITKMSTSLSRNSTIAPLSNKVPASSSSLFYIPADPKSYFRHLIKRCLERDFKVAGSELLQNPDSLTIVMSKSSFELASKVANMWRIPIPTRAVLLLDVAEEMFAEGVFTVDNLNDGFNLAKHIGTEQGKKPWVPESSWPLSDYRYLLAVLSNVQKALLVEVCKALAFIYDDSPPKIGPYLQILDEHVLSLSVSNLNEYLDLPDGMHPLDPSDKQLKQLEETITSAAETKYDTLIDNIPRDHTLDPLHIVDLADKLISIAKRLQKRYKFALFDRISIGHISAQRHLTLFSADSQSMFNYLLAHMKARKEEPSFEDMMSLYKKLSEIRGLYIQVSEKPFGFDLEASFFPFMEKWAEASYELSQTWIEPAINADSFIPGGETMHSSSVVDVFTSFRSAIDIALGLQWKNPYHIAKLLTILMKGVSAGTCLYAVRLFASFSDELRDDQETSQIRTRQEKWLALAKTAINAKEDVVPYKFLQQTCVKLNDIEKAQLELDTLETDVDSEKQAIVIAKQDRQQRKRSNGFLFTIRVIQADGLKACDINGLSDPYVTLVDQQTRKQIGKTRTVYEDLNPTWNEVFELATVGAKWLTITVWDENSITNHDLCGRAFLLLDPAKFQDFVAQDFWLDLDTQGRLLVNLSMESEEDDIRFHFGKALRTLMRTESDMIRMIVDKFTAFIRYSISLHTLKSLQGGGRFTMDTVSSWLSHTRIAGPAKSHPKLTQVEIEDSLIPLFDYLNENFSTLAANLTHDLRIKVMTKTWQVVLETIDNLLLPPLTDKRSTRQQLTSYEADIVFTWLKCLRDFFHHDGAGPSLEVLQSQRYQQIMTIPVYYDLESPDLRQESEKLSSLSFKNIQERNLFAIPELIKRKHTVMAHRNRTVVRKQKEHIDNIRRQSPFTEDIILRILKARGDHDYIVRRLRQRERIAHTLATESIVKNAAAMGAFKREFTQGLHSAGVH